MLEAEQQQQEVRKIVVVVLVAAVAVVGRQPVADKATIVAATVQGNRCCYKWVQIEEVELEPWAMHHSVPAAVPWGTQVVAAGTWASEWAWGSRSEGYCKTIVVVVAAAAAEAAETAEPVQAAAAAAERVERVAAVAVAGWDACQRYAAGCALLAR